MIRMLLLSRELALDIEIYRLPVPRDIPLPLPVPEVFLQILLVVSFLAHIFFVNLTVGSAILIVVFERLGLKDPRWDKLAYKLAATITVNKSIAVVLGIGPLLCINLLYTIQWYSANSLTGHAWLLLIPAVIVAFLLSYLHKYTWGYWSSGKKKVWHIRIGTAALLLFLLIPFIFLSNINLMLFPDTWAAVRGFLSTLFVGNVFPRYFHFLLASVAITSLFIVGMNKYNLFHFAEIQGFSNAEIKRTFYYVCAIITLAQFIIGPLLLFTLPNQGINSSLYLVILGGASCAVILLWLLRREIKTDNAKIGKNYWVIVSVFSVIVLCMGSGRAIYRAAALAPHKEAIRARTDAFEKELKEFNSNLATQKKDLNQQGEKLFLPCSGCHAVDKKLVGPALTEIATIYGDNPQGIVTWAKSPGKKRSELPQMPPFAYLGDDNLLEIAKYILEVGKQQPNK